MTFDDGPSKTLTPQLLDLLAARKAKATFFVVGQNVAEYPEIVTRAAREGHEIANHSWSHPNLAKMSDEAVRRELQKTDDAIKAATGVRPTLMRPPYGSITARQKKWMYDDFGYRTIIWDVDPFGLETARPCGRDQPNCQRHQRRFHYPGARYPRADDRGDARHFCPTSGKGIQICHRLGASGYGSSRAAETGRFRHASPSIAD